MSTSDWVGAFGVAITLVAYFCMSVRWMPAHSRTFFFLNTLGAAITCFASYLISYWPIVVLEGTWTLVSLIGWIRAGKAK